MKRLLACLLPLVLGVGATAQDVEVWIFRNVGDLPLGQVVEETAGLGGIEVEVEPGLRERRVTVLLEAPVVGAVKALAEAAGAHLWKTGEGKYAVRAKPPPPSAVPPREETEGPDLGDEDDGGDSKPDPRPAWKRKIQEALESASFEGTFEQVPLPEFLAALAKQAGVPLHLDPEVLRTRSKKELLVDFEDVLGDSSVGDALTLFCGFNDLAYDVTWGVVYVSTLDRSIRMPDSVFLSGAGGLDEKTARALESHLVSRRLKKAKLRKAVEILAKDGKVEMAVGAAAVKHCRRRTFSMVFDRRKLADALAILLVPAGLALKVAEGRLTVVVRP